MATQLKLCKYEHCSATQDEDKYKHECLLCDGYFADDGVNDRLDMDDDENEYCSLCGAGCYGLVKMKDTGDVVCADGCDDESRVEWEGVYGVKTVVKSTLVMAGGGSHWWNYIVEYTNGKQTVFIENKNGINKCVGKKLIGWHPNECIRLVGVRLVDEDYECGDGESLWDCDD